MAPGQPLVSDHASDAARRIGLGHQAADVVALVAGGLSVGGAQSRLVDAGRPVVIGSKPFGESYLLAEIFAHAGRWRFR